MEYLCSETLNKRVAARGELCAIEIRIVKAGSLGDPLAKCLLCCSGFLGEVEDDIVLPGQKGRGIEVIPAISGINF